MSTTQRLLHLTFAIPLLGVVGLGSCVAPNHHMDAVEEREIYPSNMAGLEYRVGVSEFHEAGWDRLEHPVVNGFLYRSYLEVEPLELEVGGSFGYDQHGGGSVPFERLRLYEANLGLALSTPLGGQRNALVEPYVGGGAALLFGRYDSDLGGALDHFEDASTGYYVHAGVRVYVERRKYLAFDWRWLGGVRLDLGNGQVDADQQTLSIVFGYSF